MTTRELIERLEFNGGCQNLHCGDSSRCHACDGCRQNEAAQALSTLTTEVEELRTTLTRIRNGLRAYLPDSRVSTPVRFERLIQIIDDTLKEKGRPGCGRLSNDDT
jgi:hypothetical protein